MAKRYPKRKLSTEDISRALNFDSDSDDSNDKLENFLGEDSGTGNKSSEAFTRISAHSYKFVEIRN